MKVAVILSTLALSVILCAAGGGHHHGHGKHHKSGGVTVIDPSMEGFGFSSGDFTFETLGGLRYSYFVQKHSFKKGVFATGTVIEQGDRCGFKGRFSCGNACGGEDPVCKAVFTKCGSDGAKCKSNEVCVEGACYEYECKDGYKCFNGAKTVCGQQCHTATKKVCRDEKVYVCGNGVGGGRRLSGGYNYNSGGDSAWGHGSGGDAAWGHGSGSGSSLTIGGSIVSGGNGFFDPSHNGFGFGHGGCGFVTREVCADEPYELCEEVCGIKEGFFCTDETCGADPAMVACGRGYCRFGDVCYQKSCDHACGYNKKYFCW